MKSQSGILFGLIIIGIVMILGITFSVSAATPVIDVSQPVQLTNDIHYERGESIIYDGSNYWLFYGRSDTVTGNYGNDNPDTHDYKIYYKKAASVDALSSATATLVPGSNNTNIYLGETDAVYFDGKIWVFASVDIGNGAALYAWNTTDGSSWNEWNLSAAAGIGLLPDGAAHFAAAACNGKLWIAYQLGNDWNATYWNGSSWGPEYDVTTGYGTAKFYVEGTNLYFVRASGNLYLYWYNTTSDAWELIDSVTESGAYDPTIFKVSSYYVCAYAPWISPKQWIKAKVGTSLDNLLSTGFGVNITSGMYGSNAWVDMWPYAFTDANGNTFLFFTSERNPTDPSSEITGNIWYLKIDWDVAHDHFDYIQPAIDAASDGSTIVVHDGVYKENILINKSLKLAGDPIIDGNGSIGINISANYTLIENMTIINCSKGIYADGVNNITINNCSIYNCTWPPGYGIYMSNIRDAIINDSKINDTSTGIYISASSYVNISNCDIYENGQYGVELNLVTNVILNNNNLSNNYKAIYMVSSSNNNILNCNISSNYVNEGALTLSSSSSNIVTNSLFQNNVRAIDILSGSLNSIINNTFSGNSNWDIYVTGSANNIFLNNTFSSYTTKASFTYNGDFYVKGVTTPPSMPTGVINISKFLRISLTGTGAWFNLTIYYNHTNLGGYIGKEQYLRMWKYNAGWYPPTDTSWYSWMGLDTTANKIIVNASSASVFAPLLDITSPSSSCSVLGPYWNTTGTLNITWTASDNVNLSSIELWYRYRPDNTSAWGAWQKTTYSSIASGTSDNGYWLVDLTSLNGEGLYEFATNATDDAGNYEGDPTTADDIAGYDATPPVTTKTVGEPNITENDKDYWITSNTPIWLNATDSLSGVNATYYRIWYDGVWHPTGIGDSYGGNDNVTWYDGAYWYIRFLNGSVDFEPIYFTEDCTHYLQYFSVDTAGNEEEIHNDTLYVDNTPPYSDVDDFIPYCQWVNATNPITVSVDAHDLPEGCGVGIYNVTLYYRYARYNHTFTNWISLGTLTSEPWQWSFDAPNGSGYYQFYTVAYDLFGHHEPLPDESTEPEAILCVPYNYTFSLYHGWNLVTVPVKNKSILTAEDLGEYLNSFYGAICIVITKWEAAEQRYVSHVVGYGGEGFTLKPGEGYFIYMEFGEVGETREFYMVGALVEYDDISMPLYVGYNMLGWVNIEETDARQLLYNISNCTKIGEWNEADQTWPPEYTVIAPPELPPFDVAMGDGFFAYRNVQEVILWDGGRSMLSLPPSPLPS